MDPSERYFRERARTERATAEDASSPEARRVHLELALQYAGAAEALDVSSGASTKASGPTPREQEERPAIGRRDVEPALRSAFPLPRSGKFSDLLKIIG